MIRFLEESFSSGSGDGLMVTTSSNACLILTRLHGFVDIDFAIGKKKRYIYRERERNIRETFSFSLLFMEEY